MAILAVNAGSSTLKFSLHPLRDGEVQACVLTGSIQGLEPDGTPEMSWSVGGDAPQRRIHLGRLAPLRQLGQQLLGDLGDALHRTLDGVAVGLAHRRQRADLADVLQRCGLDLFAGGRRGEVDGVFGGNRRGRNVPELDDARRLLEDEQTSRELLYLYRNTLLGA